jgi:hypothetical protein
VSSDTKLPQGSSPDELSFTELIDRLADATGRLSAARDIESPTDVNDLDGVDQ